MTDIYVMTLILLQLNYLINPNLNSSNRSIYFVIKVDIKMLKVREMDWCEQTTDARRLVGILHYLNVILIFCTQKCFCPIFSSRR